MIEETISYTISNNNARKHKIRCNNTLNINSYLNELFWLQNVYTNTHSNIKINT